MWHDFAGDQQTGRGAHLRDLAQLCRVRDRIDREYAQPLDVEALARGVNMYRQESRSPSRGAAASPLDHGRRRRPARHVDFRASPGLKLDKTPGQRGPRLQELTMTDSSTQGIKTV